MESELEDLASNGMIVYDNNNEHFLKVHFLGSFGDIPSISEVNFLADHMSFWVRKFCVFFSNRENRMFFSHAANNPSNQPCLRTIEEFKNSGLSHDVKKSSIFKNLPSLINVYFLGIDEFHMFSLNISTKLRNFFIGTVKDKRTILQLEKIN